MKRTLVSLIIVAILAGNSGAAIRSISNRGSCYRWGPIRVTTNRYRSSRYQSRRYGSRRYPPRRNVYHDAKEGIRIEEAPSLFGSIFGERRENTRRVIGISQESRQVPRSVQTAQMEEQVRQMKLKQAQKQARRAEERRYEQRKEDLAKNRRMATELERVSILAEDLARENQELREILLEGLSSPPIEPEE